MGKATALKKRYISFRVKCDNEFSEENIKHALYGAALNFFGEYGLSFVALKLISYDEKNRVATLRCARDDYGKVLGFLALVSELDRKSARTIAIASSGTLDGLSKKIEKRQKRRSET